MGNDLQRLKPHCLFEIELRPLLEDQRSNNQGSSWIAESRNRSRVVETTELNPNQTSD